MTAAQCDPSFVLTLYAPQVEPNVSTTGQPLLMKANVASIPLSFVGPPLCVARLGVV